MLIQTVMKLLEKNPNSRIKLEEFQKVIVSTNSQRQIQKIETLEKEIQTLRQEKDAEIENLQRQIQALQLENQNQKNEISLLKGENSNLFSQNEILKTSVFQPIPTSHSAPSPELEVPSVHQFQTQIEKWLGKKTWTLLYQGTRDGFGSKTFHAKCDLEGATVTIIKSTTGFFFGGYTPLPWKSSGGWIEDSTMQSFIFTLKNPHNIPPTKYPIKDPCTLR